ncbi:MAG: hypothetical protein ACPGVG_16915, partial [Mycobacterium sp.]
QKRVLPCAAYVDGALGLNGMYVGVPTVIVRRPARVSDVPTVHTVGEAMDWVRSLTTMSG